MTVRGELVLVEAFGRVATVGEWARAMGVRSDIITSRLRGGWTPEDAVSATHLGTARGELWEGACSLPYEADPIAQVVVRTFGAMTLEQVGGCMGLTRERVRQIESRAFRRIRDSHGEEVLLELLKGWRELREAWDERRCVRGQESPWE